MMNLFGVNPCQKNNMLCFTVLNKSVTVPAYEQHAN